MFMCVYMCIYICCRLYSAVSTVGMDYWRGVEKSGVCPSIRIVEAHTRMPDHTHVDVLEHAKIFMSYVPESVHTGTSGHVCK